MENMELELDIFSNLSVLKLSRTNFIIQLFYIISNNYLCKSMLILKFKAYFICKFVTK